MKMLSRIAGTVLLAACLWQPATAAALTIGQIDDFQDGTTQNWIIGDPIGNPVPPVIVPNGGPAGAGDQYLLLTADGGSGLPGPDPGSRLAVINEIQWAGNYLTAGVNAITMWVNNLTPDLNTPPLSLRLYVADNAFLNIAISTVPVLLPAGSGWTTVVFPFGPADLTAIKGSVKTALANAAELRIFHNPNATWPPPAIVANLGVDNIKALRRGPLPSLPLLLLDE